MTRASLLTSYIRSLRSYATTLDRRGLAIFVIAMLLTVVGLIGASIYQAQAEDSYNAALLNALWRSYQQQNWNTNGRTYDPQNSNVTTSEAQGYTMLRAVWSDDRTTFDQTWQWTAAHLERSDKLFGWRYGRLPGGTDGILTSEGGENTASDADVDIATALLLASSQWHDQQYRTSARDVIAAIWNQEVIAAHGRLYLAADNLEKQSQLPTFVVNPSYLAPYAFRLFDRLDSSHSWSRLADDSYYFLQSVGSARLGGKNSAGLPPDWVAVDRRTGVLRASPNPGQTTDFGYNAFRVLWRVGLDWQWFHPDAAQQTFKSYGILNAEWQKHHSLAAVYGHDGTPKVAYESLALYGGTLGYFDATSSDTADDIVRTKIEPLYDPTHHQLKSTLSYYDNNWVWFGLALYENKLPDLVAGGGIS